MKASEKTKTEKHEKHHMARGCLIITPIYHTPYDTKHYKTTKTKKKTLMVTIIFSKARNTYGSRERSHGKLGHVQ